MADTNSLGNWTCPNESVDPGANQMYRFSPWFDQSSTSQRSGTAGYSIFIRIARLSGFNDFDGGLPNATVGHLCHLNNSDPNLRNLEMLNLRERREVAFK